MKDGVRARYTLEFKREAVRLVRGGETLTSAARMLGVSGVGREHQVGLDELARSFVQGRDGMALNAA